MRIDPIPTRERVLSCNPRHASHHHFISGFVKGHGVWRTITRRRLKIVSFDKAAGGTLRLKLSEMSGQREFVGERDQLLQSDDCWSLCSDCASDLFSFLCSASRRPGVSLAQTPVVTKAELNNWLKSLKSTFKLTICLPTKESL